MTVDPGLSRKSQPSNTAGINNISNIVLRGQKIVGMQVISSPTYAPDVMETGGNGCVLEAINIYVLETKVYKCHRN